MATVATQSQYPASAAPLPGPRYDNGFFSVVGDSGSRDRFDRLRPHRLLRPGRLRQRSPESAHVSCHATFRQSNHG